MSFHHDLFCLCRLLYLHVLARCSVLFEASCKTVGRLTDVKFLSVTARTTLSIDLIKNITNTFIWEGIFWEAMFTFFADTLLLDMFTFFPFFCTDTQQLSLIFVLNSVHRGRQGVWVKSTKSVSVVLHYIQGLTRFGKNFPYHSLFQIDTFCEDSFCI